jgi:hypothetical protein
LDERQNPLFHFLQRAETASVQQPAAQNAKPNFNLVQPRKHLARHHVQGRNQAQCSVTNVLILAFKCKVQSVFTFHFLLFTFHFLLSLFTLHFELCTLHFVRLQTGLILKNPTPC